MSLKKTILAALTACVALSSVAFAENLEPPAVAAQAAYVMDADTGDELYAKQPDLRGYPGSTTKMMTCIVALENGQGIMDKTIRITDKALSVESDASVLGLQQGDQITLRNALTGMMLVSGCDAAVAIAETVEPTEDAFVAKMNAKAAALGATHTHFVNPHGLPDANHYSTARDLAKIGAYGMKLPAFRDIVKRSTFDMPYVDGSYKHCVSTNEFLTSGFPGANGIKTGTTNAGGPCLVVSATQNGRTVIAAIMNSEDRYGDAQALMKYGFSVLKPLENVYIIRKAPAGQTLTELGRQQMEQAKAAADAKAKSKAAQETAYGTDADTADMAAAAVKKSA